jgi:large subunit ribosomal protein L10
MSKRVKQLMVGELSQGLADRESCVVVGLGPLDVMAATELRTDLRQSGIRLRVLKNRLAVHAFREVGWEGLEQALSGSSAVAYGDGGVMAASKVLVDWEKKSAGRVQIRGGVLDGRLLAESEVRQLATIPDKPVLYSMLAAAVSAPVSQVASLVGEILGGVARAIGAVAAREESEE